MTHGTARPRASVIPASLVSAAVFVVMVFALVAPAMAACNFDVDESGGAPTAAVDGALIVRHLSGFSGNRLTDGAIESNSKRRTAADIQSFLRTQSYDIDDNGGADPLTDGLIITRYLQGITGAALVRGALGPGARRTNPDDILNHLRAVDGCGNNEVLAQRLPIEVIGAEGTERAVQLMLSADQVSRAQRLWLQTHNVRYPEKASVKINGGAWLPLNNTNAQMIGTSQTYGGIGGSFATLKMSIPFGTGANAGALRAGPNSITFRFNVSNDVSAGFRVIGINVLDNAGQKLIAENGFSHSDPSTWTATSSAPSDIDAGRVLWASAALRAHFDRPNRPAPNLLAKCADCHTQNGADLKYFGYSNQTIIERAKFHGLSQTQGEQIASYIRNLPVKAVGRPWNPPYQPGPGTSSKPNDEWAAGAGIDNVLDRDEDTIAALFPNGVRRDVLMEGDGNKFKRFSSHDTPLAFQLPDWNHWLPEVHPLDSVKSWFEASDSLAHYRKLRQQLTGKTPEQIRQWFRDSNNGEGAGRLASRGYFAMVYFYGDSVSAIAENVYPTRLNQNGRITDPAIAKQMYSFGLWKMVKHFEIHEEFKLTGLGRDTLGAEWNNYDPKEALPRMWIGANRTVFDVSPFLSSLENGVTGSASGNTVFNYDYLSNAWYQLQLILNAGQRTGFNHQVVDFGYAYGFLNHVDRATDYTQVGRNFVWAIKGMDEGDNDRGPNMHDGWSFNRASLRPINSYLLSSAGRATATPLTRQAMALLTQVWLEKNASWLPEQIFSYPDGSPKSGNEDGVQFDRPDYVLDTGNNEYQDRGHADNLYGMMPGLLSERTYPPALQNGYAAWAQTMWPGKGSDGIIRNNWLQFSYPRVGVAAAAPSLCAGATPVSVNVTWQPVSGADSYNVKRAETANGPYLTVAYLRTGTSYTDIAPLAGNGRTYFYRVTSNSVAGESPDSASAAVVR